MKKFYGVVAVAFSASLSSQALAQSAANTPEPVAVAVVPAAPASMQGSDSGAKAAGTLPRRLGMAVSAVQLNAERGKADTVSYEASLGGVVSGNSASNVATGANRIDAGSFADMVGLPVVIQNTGANVLIQNSTIVNVQFR